MKFNKSSWYHRRGGPRARSYLGLLAPHKRAGTGPAPTSSFSGFCQCTMERPMKIESFTKILLSLGLLMASHLTMAAEPTEVNSQITDAVSQTDDTVITTAQPTEVNGQITDAVSQTDDTVITTAQPTEVNGQTTDAVSQVDETVTITQPDAQQLLEFIDSLRGYGDQSFSFELSNISYKKNQQKNRNKLAVQVLGDSSLVEFVAPARSKGRKILKQSQNMWIRFPGTRNVLRISPAQRLLGEASNGDVTGTNFSQDYTATLEDSEVINDQPTIRLRLTANHNKATYKEVVFFLNSETHLPLRSDFYARSGKLSKQAFYTKFKEFDGELKLHRMRLVNPLVEGSYTWMMFDNYQKQTLDSAVFHKDALSR